MSTAMESHTLQRYDTELQQLRSLVTAMGTSVLGQLRTALTALEDGNKILAQQVIDRDNDIDRYELDTDHSISRLIALRAPVASDLRFVMAASKSVSELELIGDEAAKIASLVLFSGEADHSLACEIGRMGGLALASVENGVALLDDWNEFKAHKVMANHHDLDKAFETILSQLMTKSAGSSREVSSAISLVLAAKALERVGHHAQNLAEYVMLQVKNEIIRQDDR